MHTITQIEAITGIRNIEFSAQGKWLVSDQRGSKGVMANAVAALKAAGIPAFFSATDRTWGVLAEEVSE